MSGFVFPNDDTDERDGYWIIRDPDEPRAWVGARNPVRIER